MRQGKHAQAVSELVQVVCLERVALHGHQRGPLPRVGLLGEDILCNGHEF